MNTFVTQFFLLDISLNPLPYLKRLPKWVKYLSLAVLACFIVCLPSLAQASNVLQGQLDQMQNSQAWWDNLWQNTYNPSGGGNGTGTGGSSASDFMLTSVTAWLFRLSVLYFCWRFILKSPEFYNGNITSIAVTLGPMLLPFFASVMMLSNNGALAGAVPVTMRAITNNWRNGIMEARIIDVTPREALNDIFATKDGSNKIYLQANECAKMPQPAVALPSATYPTDPQAIAKLTPSQIQGYNYIDCLRKLKTVSEEVQATCPIINVGNCGKFFRDFLNRTVRTITGSVDATINDLSQGKVLNPIDPMLGLVASFAKNEAIRPVLTTVQWAYTNSLELAFWIDALIAPIACALMLIPGRLNLFVAWFISLFTICLAQLLYALIAGVNALLISQTAYDPGDLTFEMALGVFGPLMSLSIVAGGGFAAAQSFTGQSVAVGAAVSSAVTGAISSSMSRIAASKKW